ncbi:MAG TPA: hypothetical protein VMU95_06390 [Trebonia sp.]|nr:hypothetical protein [Trebonia sp.]
MTTAAMTPREEVLATQRIGRAGATLLYRLVYLVAIGRNFPPPPGFDRWDPSAVTETAHDFLDGPRGVRRVMDIAIRSADEPGFERVLEQAVVNHLRDISRRTDMGRLVRRVTEVLTDEPAFSRVTGGTGAPGKAVARWALKDGPDAPSGVPETTLIAALARVEVTIPEWSSERRSAPLADRGSFTRMLTAVMAAADGSLTAPDIARVIATRLDHHRTPLSLELEVLEVAAERSSSLDPAVRASSAVRAAQIFAGLTENERILLACFDLPVRDLGAVLTLRKSQASLLRQRLATRLHDELADDEDPDDTVAELCRRCEQWTRNRTAILDATLGQGDHTEGKGER